MKFQTTQKPPQVPPRDPKAVCCGQGTCMNTTDQKVFLNQILMGKVMYRCQSYSLLRNSKRRLKIECLRYSSNFGYQNSLMCETFGQNLRRSIFERFHLFMNCCYMFFHVILDRKLNVSDTAQTLATRIV